MNESNENNQDELKDLKKQFFRFCENHGGDSPLYNEIGKIVAKHDKILELYLNAPKNQRLPVLLFASVHFLILNDKHSHELAEFYPTSNHFKKTRDLNEIENVFIDFCEKFKNEIINLLKTKATQTNEIGRCRGLLPAYLSLAEIFAGKSFAVIEVGTSAGLNLFFDKYNVDYGDGVVLQANSEADVVRLECTVDEKSRASLKLLGDKRIDVKIASRTGIDQNVLRPSHADDALWLRACMWPDQTDRHRRLQQACAYAAEHADDVRLIEGDANQVLPGVLKDIDAPEVVPVVTTSWVLNYFSTEARETFFATLNAYAQHHDIAFIAFERYNCIDGIPPPQNCPLDVTTISVHWWCDGTHSSRCLATTHPHANHLQWF